LAEKKLLFDDNKECLNLLTFIERAQMVAKDPIAVAE
jgi:hypothetical protein